MSETMDRMNDLARRKLSGHCRPDWEICKMEWVGRHMLIEGGVPHVISRGPNKGRKRWDRTALTKLVLTEADIESIGPARKASRPEGAAGEGDGDGN